ncbi:MBL fold metallo-hydrolase [Methylocystis rosea]|uniref:MBL fold metallo-hydrolase n=1 Tax=Methylocystis rosea TaxID=173366 RepID=A0A3G8M3S9_9HYPH|nr:MBL fold metallo-hydrolase [Methylocystis rosea]
MRPLGRNEGAVIQAGTHPDVSARVSPLTRRALAPNPGPFTYRGTCSYLVGNGDVAIIDPGPDDPRHIGALLASIGGERLRYVLVTHTHRDHSPAARALKEATGAIIAGCAPHMPRESQSVDAPNLDAAHDRSYAPDILLRDGDTLEIGGASLVALATPGHTANHLCFALAKEQALFTGDHVMAWATTVIAPPDGSMGAYMASLERLRGRGDRIYWPGHGEPVHDPQRFLRALLHHRRAREAAILQRLELGDETIAEIVAHIYEGVDKRLHVAAAMTALAHLEDLISRDLVDCAGPPGLQARFSPRRG